MSLTTAWCSGNSQKVSASSELSADEATMAAQAEETIAWEQLQVRGRDLLDKRQHAHSELPQLLKRNGGSSPSALPRKALPIPGPSGLIGRCCARGGGSLGVEDLDLVEKGTVPEGGPASGEEVVNFLSCMAPSCNRMMGGCRGSSTAACTSVGSSPPNKSVLPLQAAVAEACSGAVSSSPNRTGGALATATESAQTELHHGYNWGQIRPLLMTFLLVATVVTASFVHGNNPGQPSWESALRYGSIPIVAAIIGYGTNVAALKMMFFPIEFMGCFPNLKIGCGLDLPLCGWQGVIPMKAVEMATLSVDLMTQKLIKVEEIFGRLDPNRVAEEVSDLLPSVVSGVINDAGRKHCPVLWEHLPARIRRQHEEQVAKDAKHMMACFMKDLQKNISEVFDLKACVVDVLVRDRSILNDTFLLCGKEEFEFIKVSGFYLGFIFGLLQMVVWMFLKLWFILPLCGVIVGWATNVVALKVIFWPIEPRRLPCGLPPFQGLFLQRQKEVSALYARQCAERILSAEVLINSLVAGPKAEEMYRLVDKHVAACMEDQAVYWKPLFLLSIGSETWVDFRQGMCEEFRKKLPTLLAKIQGYMQEAMQLEGTLRSRLEQLPATEFERLLHAVFEQDEFKLILVGAILGFLVGFLQAMIQTPDQLGIGGI